MDLIPKIKKSISSFLTSEEGKISKQSLLLLGTLASIATIASLSSTSVHAQCSCGGGGCGASSSSSGTAGTGTSGGCAGTGGSSGCAGAPGSSGSVGCSGCAGAGATGGASSGTASSGCAGTGGSSGCAGAGCGGGGGGGNGGCFTYNQLVLTPEGVKEISEIKVGTKVISYDEKADTFTTSTVGSVIIHDGKVSFLNDFQKHPLIKLSIKINDEVIVTKVTDNHRYFDTFSKAYKQLMEFEIGDKVKTLKGYGIIVEKSNIIDKNSLIKEHNEIVYNLEMKEGPQNYIVNGAVVHNGGK